MPLEIRPGDFSKLVSEFIGMLDIHPSGGFIDKEHLRGNWKFVGEDLYPNKLTAINKRAGIFVKFYPPQTGDYAQKVFKAAHEHAQIEGLPYPILIPEVVIDGALVFKAGKHVFNIVFDALDDLVQQRMAEITARNGLTPLARFNKLAVIEIDGTNYLTDTIEDSVYSISQYCEQD